MAQEFSYLNNFKLEFANESYKYLNESIANLNIPSFNILHFYFLIYFVICHI